MPANHSLIPSCLFPEVYWPWKSRPGFLVQQIERIAGEGFYRAIEIGPVPDKRDRDAVRALCQEHGLSVSTWLTEVLYEHDLDISSVDEDLRKRSVEIIKQHLPAAIECGSKTVALIGGADPGPALRERGYESCFKSLVAICAGAANLGAAVMFEPLDRFAHKKRLVGPTDEAVALFSRVRQDYPDFGFAFDTAHAALNEEDVVASLGLAKAQIVNVHLSNAVLDKTDPLYGDHHIMPGEPGFLTVEKASAIIAAAARSGIGGDRELGIAVEARAQPTVDEQETVDIATQFLKAAFARAETLPR